MYFLRRILLLIPLLLVISFMAFALVRLTPGSPFDRERKPGSPEIERAIHAKYHLDEPFLQQYFRYIGGLLHGDFGPSLKYRNHTVTDIVVQALPVSMTLGAIAFGFAMGVGLPVGFFTAARRGRWPDYAGSFFAILMICVPALVMAPVLVMILGIKWRLLPVAQWISPWHMILPVAALGLFFSGRIARLMREGMLNTMKSEYITTARAKGLSENAVLLKHGFRLAVLPVVSYAGPLLADLLTGAFVIEAIFQIPGLGTHFVNSSLNQDYTMTVGLALLYAALLVVMNLLVDFLYTLLDPRVKYE
jgi:oligopeptide transport system permease protein